MEWGILAVLTSIIVALYSVLVWFVCTRYLVRSVCNYEAPPIRLEVVVVDKKGKSE